MPAAFRARPFASAVLAAAALGFAGGPLGATDYSVTVLVDEVADDGNCTLREALLAAGSNLAYDACPAGTTDDLITLPAGTVQFDGGGVYLIGAEGTITVEGPSLDPSQAIVSCANAGRFLSLFNTDVTLRDFSITACLGGAENGGAVRAAQSALALRNMQLYGNKASSRGGAVEFVSDNEAYGGDLVVEDSDLDSNSITNESSDPQGGALFVRLAGTAGATIVRSSFSSNSLVSFARPTEGGGLAVVAMASSQVVLREVEFDDNRCGAALTSHHGCGLAVTVQDAAHSEISGAGFSGNYPVSTAYALQINGAWLLGYGNATLLAERLSFEGNVNPLSGSVIDIQLGLDFRDATSAIVRDVLAVHANTAIHALALYGTPSVRLDHLTVSDHQWGAMLTVGATGTLWLQNSILWGNSVGDVDPSGSVSMAANHIGGGDPLFAAPGLGDYRLTEASPDVDAGDDGLDGVGRFDLDHAPRVVGAATDRGAYELGGLFADDFESGDTSAWSSPH